MVIRATLLALVAAASRGGTVALAVERIAYRPLRKKNAPPLIFLITAIGCSLVLVEIFGHVLRQFFGAAVRPRAPVNVPSPDPDHDADDHRRRAHHQHPGLHHPGRDRR